MAYPTPIVEIAFDDGPYVASPTWTDVSSWVRRMSIDRGRFDDWGNFDGIASVVLNNRTRRFDPYFTTGPYYGKLLPRRQIRIRAQTIEGGVTSTVDVFRGFVDGWNPEWTDAGTDSTVTLQCFDAMQLLSTERLPADYARPYILSLGPRHYYPLDEPIVTGTTTTLRDLGSFPQPATTTNAVSDRQLAFGLAQKSVQLISGLAPTIPDTTTRNFTCSMWANYRGGNLFFVGRYYMDMYFDSADNRYTATIYDHQLATFRRYKSIDTFEGGDPFMLTVTYNAPSSTALMYLNGTLISTSLTTGSVSPPIGNSEGLLLGTGQFQQIIVYHYELNATQIRTIYNLSDAIFPETTAARFNRIIAESPFPASLTSPASAPANSVLDITTVAPTITDELRVTANSEGGPLFVSKNGTITMFNQKQIWTQTRSLVSQVTYGFGGQKLGQTIQVTSDGDSMRNTAFVSMSGDGVLEQQNNTSVTTFGSSALSLETHVQTIANAQSLAEIITGWGGQMYPLLSPADVVLSANDVWKPTLDLELMDRITVNVKPPTGNTISQKMLVQRIRHDVVPGFWQTTLEGSARWAAVFILNQSTLGGLDLLG